MPVSSHFRSWRLGAIVFLTVGASAIAQYTPIVPLKVTNGSNVAKSQELVTVPVPVGPLTALTHTYGVRVVDPSGQYVPAQFKVLTRWDGVRDDTSRPIRWLSAIFKADVPANSTVEYTLALAPGTYVPGALWATQNMDEVAIWTAPDTHFTIDRLAFTVFKQVVVDGVTVTSEPGGLDFEFADGADTIPFVTETVLEEYQGWLSTRAVVRQRGWIGPLKFTLRYTFVGGRKDVTLDFRLENPLPYGLFATSIADGQRYFKRLFLQLPIAGVGHVATSTVGARPLAAGPYVLEQDFAWTNNLDSWAGFSFTEKLGVDTIATGGRYAGALDLSSTGSGVTVSVDRFWQNFPKAFEASGNLLRVGLWPEFGDGPQYQGQYALPGAANPPPDPAAAGDYRFEGGRWKTHRMTLDFHAGGPRTPSAVAAEADRAATPLIGMPPAAYIRQSGAMHTLWSERMDWPQLLMDRYERFYDLLVDDQAADSLASVGRIGYPEFVKRGGTSGGWQHYGWENYGDLGWADGYSSLHYDMTESFLSGYLRTGDYRFFAQGRDLAAYRRDYGQNHSTSTSETWRGAQFYEKGWWHGNYATGQYSHNWVGGLLLHYILTGDEASREAAVENLAFVLRDPPKNWSGYWGSRIPGWQINCLMDAYSFLGDPVYLDEAGLGVARFKTLEVAQGSKGYLLNLGTNPQTTKPWMDDIFFIAAAKYMMQSLDFASVDLLDRMREYFKTVAMTLPSGASPNLVPAQVYYEWGPAFTGVKSIHLLWPMCEAFAWSAVIFSDINDFYWSQLCFETVCRYWQSGPTTAPVNHYDASTWGKVTFKPAQYPGTESKVLGNLLRWGPAYLTVTRILEGNW